jgi:hypothetical protein
VRLHRLYDLKALLLEYAEDLQRNGHPILAETCRMIARVVEQDAHTLAATLQTADEIRMRGTCQAKS